MRASMQQTMATFAPLGSGPGSKSSAKAAFLARRSSVWLMAESLRTTRRGAGAGHGRRVPKPAPDYPDPVPRMWIWLQAAIVVFVLAGMVIAIVKMS